MPSFHGALFLYIDLHAHTYPASDDSFISADDLIDCAKRTGLDGICLTEHDHFWLPEDVERLAKETQLPRPRRVRNQH